MAQFQLCLRMVNSTCNYLNLSQLVKQPTRHQFNSIKKTTSSSCIDHIYTNAKYRCSNVEISSFGSSDHDLIGYTRYSKDPPEPSRTIRKRTYKNFNTDLFIKDLRKVDWRDILACGDIEHAVELFTQKFKFILDIHAPWVVYQQRKHFNPWLTSTTIELMKERDRAKKDAINARNDFRVNAPEKWTLFKTLRNKVNNRRKYEEKTYKLEKIKESLGCSSNMWKTSKRFMEWTKGSGSPHQLEVSGKLVTKAADVAATMNYFFIEKIQKIRSSILRKPNDYKTCSKIMGQKKCKFALEYVSVKRVNKMLKSLKNSTSTSIDGLDNLSVKLAADHIDVPLHHIITLSVMQNRFPECWKLSKVIPLHKKESQTEAKNYRPVTLLSPFSKVLEKIVYEQLYHYFKVNKIFHRSMHGFRQNRSTTTALLSAYDKWIRAAANGQVSGIVMLDLSAAFDLVEHDILLKKLKVYGVEEGTSDWIRSYLTERHQAVWIDHVLSDFLPCNTGVPQGSNLGPMFFSIYLSTGMSS